MKKNMGTTDRVVRILAAAVLGALFLARVIGGMWGIVLLAVAGIFTVTSLAGICPLYSLLHISTCKPGKV
ncbi:YgaP family membrane protein [Puia sp. P3]|uniref:YgaP family membrane protein n=1 Tax=Puia sp. P3 TaxID=3423952 RepID=UPI003D66FF30